LGLLALGCSRKHAEALPVIAELPEPSLVDQDGNVFDGTTIKDGLWVTAFVFTHCRATCPRLMAQMKDLQSRVSDVPSAHFLSVSVDPRNDTPDVIKAYMSKNGLDETNWRFVTGHEKAIQEFVVDGFKVGYGRTQWSTELTHSNSFALVDDRARIRGYYGSDDDGLVELERDLRTLASAMSSKR
jgi:protein SCO1/2